MNQEKQYSDPVPRSLSSDPLKQETDWTDERPNFAAQAELIRHVQAASPPSPFPAVQRKPVSAAPQSPSSSVAQFTLADAQELWQQWYVLATVPPSEEKIRAYIEARKRGWKMLSAAYSKPFSVPAVSSSSLFGSSQSFPSSSLSTSSSQTFSSLSAASPPPFSSSFESNPFLSQLPAGSSSAIYSIMDEESDKGSKMILDEDVSFSTSSSSPAAIHSTPLALQPLGSDSFPPGSSLGTSFFSPAASPEPVFTEGMEEEIASTSSSSFSEQMEGEKEKKDQDECERIRSKMNTMPLDTARKRTRDIHRYEEVAKLIEYSKSYGDARIALNLFFHKNAPLGYNRHSGATPVYDVKYERDYTFGKPSPDSSSSSPFLPLRTNTEYLRTSSQHPHIFRKEMNDLLKKKYGDDLEAGNKKVYLSFNVKIEEDGSRLQIVSKEWSYENSLLLGGRKDNVPNKVKVKIGKNELVLWVNTLTAGHGSLYNAAGIVPNMIQFEQIKEELKLDKGPYVAEVDSETPLELKNRSFHAATRRSVLSDETGEQGLTGKYKENLLTDRRRLVEELSKTINQGFQGKYVYAVVNEKKTDFLQYPCLILEPVQGDWRDSETSVDELKRILVTSIHASFDISFANRPSFGFAYPTVGDVGVSVRIWPGLIPAPLFWQLIIKACRDLYTLIYPNVSFPLPASSVPPVGSVALPSFPVPSGGTSSPSSSLVSAPQSSPLISSFSAPYIPQSPLAAALITARMRARERFKRYDDKKSALEQDQTLRYIYQWVNNRIVANLIKANQLIRLLAVDPVEPKFVARAVRTLENLNEYDLIQASAEEELLKKLDKDPEERTKELTDRLQNTVPSQMGNYILLSVKILSSGMEAYRVAVETIGGVPEEGDSLYFETKKLIKNLNKIGPSYGEVTRMQDPSYNFVDRKDAASDKNYHWPKTISSSYGRPICDPEKLSIRIPIVRTGLPTVDLYDTTNTSLVDTFSLVNKEFPDVVVCFESLSKHFQLGMDKTTLGRLIVYVKDTSRDMAKAEHFPALLTLAQRFVSIPDTPLPNFFLNYIEMQSRLFGV